METDAFIMGSMCCDQKSLQRSACDGGELLKKHSKTVSAGRLHDCSQLQPATINGFHTLS